jgi:hypothetical protein
MDNTTKGIRDDIGERLEVKRFHRDFVDKNSIYFRILKTSHVCVPLRGTKCIPVREAGEMLEDDRGE